jgi:hypothetical protein
MYRDGCVAGTTCRRWRTSSPFARRRCSIAHVTARDASSVSSTGARIRRGVGWGGGGGGRDGGDDDASSEAAAEDAFAAWISAGAAAREDSSVVSGIAASDAARGWGVVSWLLRLSWRRVSRLMSTKKSSVS